MNAALSKLSSHWLPVLAAWTVLVVGLAATAWLTASAHLEMTERDAERFRYETEQLVARLDTRLRTYTQALIGMRNWYSAHQEKMTKATWTNDVYTMDIPRHYPGLYEVGFVERVLDKNAPNTFPEREDHLRRMREEYGPGYDLHLPPGGVAGSSWYQMPVVRHSYGQWRDDPAREYRHYGMDLNQNPDLWAAMNWALGHDRAALSGRQVVDPDNPKVTGLLLFLPVYRPALDRSDPITLTETERKIALTPQLQEEAKAWRRYSDNLRGLIFGGIDMRTFLQSHLGTSAPTITFALYASTNQSPSDLPEQLLFDNRVPRSHTVGRDEAPSSPRILAGKEIRTRQSLAPPELRAVRDLRLYGRVLRFVLEPGPAFTSALNERTLWLAASFGVATTLLLSGFMAYQARAHRKERDISGALRQSEARLQALLHERERMSRDLHDGTIQSLYAIGLGLGRLRRALGGAPERDRLDASLVELDHVVAELRSYLVTLDPGVSPAQSAVAALSELVARLRQTAETELRFAADPGVGEGWPPAAVLDLLLAAREGVSNALRHGHATQVELALREAGRGGVHFTMTDNGQGFDPRATRPNGGHGLANLERRARAWQGWLELQSKPGGPTCLTLALFPRGGQTPGSRQTASEPSVDKQKSGTDSSDEP
jgi:signal transduction histidine kinase